jgi:DNA repair exonuclease SbcCD ATPase subunit
MNRSSLIALVCVIVGSYFLFQNLRPISSGDEETTVARSAPATTLHPTTASTVSQASSAAQTAARQQNQEEVQQLKNQLEEERRQLQNQTEALATLQSQKTQQDEQAALNTAAQISTRTQELQSLNEQLENQRLAERDILEATATALRDQSSQVQLVREQIDQSIRAAEESISQIQDQIRFWSTNTYSVTDREAQLESLQAALNQQQQALNDLRIQRLNVSAQVFLQQRNIEAQAQQQKNGLIENQNEIQTRIADLRTELRQLQDQQARRQMTPVPIEDQIRQTQALVKQQSDRVQALESELQSKQSESSQTR